MKKTVLSGFIFASLLLFVVFTSCKKEEATNSPSNVGTATLTGRVQTELDLSNSTMENVPAGTKIIAVINSADLVTNPDPNLTYEDISYETQVDGSGNYTFSNIAAANQAVTVTLYPVDFIYNQVQWDLTTVRKIYTVTPNPTQVVIKGTTKVLDFNYN
jgi:hypothetical protein